MARLKPASDTIKLPLGDMTKCAAYLDDPGAPNSEAYRRLEHGKGWVRGTRVDLLEVLYYIESCPAAFMDGADPIERSAVVRTIKSWRSKLFLDDGYKVPVPESAQR